MNDIETRDAAAFLGRYPNASDEALEAHLAECRVRRWAEWLLGAEVVQAAIVIEGEPPTVVLRIVPKAYVEHITLDVGFAAEVLRG